jgi:energy-coupling factor transport system substrate-specific component
MSLETKLKEKETEEQKEKEVDVVETTAKASQRLALRSLLQQLQIIKLKEWLVMAGFVGGASALRVGMQFWPNVEPLTFFALLSGWLFGKRKGALVGISSLYFSNFLVFGGQGPWTIYQAIAYGIAGFLGGFLRKKASVFETVGFMLVATVILQTIFNIGFALSVGGNILLAFVTGIPFLIPHVISNSVFGLFLPLGKKLVDKVGRFNEKEICDNVLDRARNGPLKQWVPDGKSAEEPK